MSENIQESMLGKICMVTGANAGIGKATAEELAKLGAHVVMVCRDEGRGRAARTDIVAASGNESVDLMLADLSSQSDIRRLAEEFRAEHQRLHVLVNNAGALYMRRQLSIDGLEKTFALNHLGYFLLTKLLLDVVKASAPARIVNVASAAHWNSSIRFDDLQRVRNYSFMEVYGQSKLANVLFTFELSRRLEGTGVTVNCMHPGLVGSNFAHNNGWIVRLGTMLIRPFARSNKKGAETVVYLATSSAVEGASGGYYVDMMERPSSPESRDESIAGRLWQVSEALTGTG